MTAADIYRVGLTGGIGSGKSTVADRFVSLGAALIDTDAIAHRLTAPGGGAIEAIRERFGDGDDHRRRAARSRGHARPRLQPPRGAAGARGDPASDDPGGFGDGGRGCGRRRRRLRDRWRSRCWSSRAAARQRVERVLVVDCPEEVQVARVMKRSALAREQVEAIMRAQATRQQRLAVADDVIDNGGDEARLDAQVRPLHETYVALGRAWKHGQRQAIAP